MGGPRVYMGFDGWQVQYNNTLGVAATGVHFKILLEKFLHIIPALNEVFPPHFSINDRQT